MRGKVGSMRKEEAGGRMEGEGGRDVEGVQQVGQSKRGW